MRAVRRPPLLPALRRWAAASSAHPHGNRHLRQRELLLPLPHLLMAALSCRQRIRMTGAAPQRALHSAGTFQWSGWRTKGAAREVASATVVLSLGIIGK